MGGEGAPSPWAGPISILRDMGGTAEAEGRLLLAQKPVEALSSSDDEGLTFSIRRQQGELRCMYAWVELFGLPKSLLDVIIWSSTCNAS